MKMERKVMDLADQIDQELTAELEMTEEEVYELSSGVRLRRIENRALKAVKPRRRGYAGRVALIAAAVAVAATTVVAVSQWDLIRAFWGDKAELPDEEFMPAGQTAAHDGMAMRVENVVNGGTDVMVFLSFTKEDGSVFLAEEQPVELSVEGGRAGVVSKHLSEDGKTLFYCFEESGVDTENLQIHARDFYLPKKLDRESELPLGSAFDAAAVRISKEQGQGVNIADRFVQAAAPQLKLGIAELPLAKEYPDIQFAGVGYIGDDLAIGLTVPMEQTDGVYASVSALRDIRTGVEYQARGYSNAQFTTGSFRCLNLTYFGPPEGMPESDPDYKKYPKILEEDLPYLIPVIRYHTRQYTVRGAWELTVPLTKAGSSFEQALDLTLERDGETVVLGSISVSPMGVSVRGKALDKAGKALYGLPQFMAQIKLNLADGSQLVLIPAGAHSGEEDFIWNYALPSGDAHNWKAFLQPDQVTGIEVDRNLVPRN